MSVSVTALPGRSSATSLTAEISWEYVQPLEANSSKLALNIARDQMNEMHPADLADIIENIPIQNIRTVLDSIDAETTGETTLRTRIGHA